MIRPSLSRGMLRASLSKVVVLYLSPMPSLVVSDHR